VLFPIYGIRPAADMKKFNDASKNCKEVAKKLDAFLKDKEWLVGNKISLADIYVGGCFSFAFQTFFDSGFRKAMPRLSAWFERFSQNPQVKKRCGNIKACQKALKPLLAGSKFATASNKEEVKAFIDTPINSSGLGLQIVAGISGVDLEMVYGADKKNSMNGRLPYLETADGSKISENMAIMKHIARMSPGSGLLGSNTFEQAQIDSLVAWCQGCFLPDLHDVLFPIYGIRPAADMKKFNDASKNCKEVAKKLDAFLKDKEWLVGNKISLADIYVGGCFSFAFQTFFDSGFRKAMPRLSAWFERFSQHPEVKKRCGNIKSCQKALKPLLAGAKPAPAKPAAAPKKEEDDMDLFGDDEESAADLEAAKKKAQEQSKAKKEKKKVIEQSMVMFEVKPVDSETNLDDLAQKIFKLTGDGIYWKTNYRKDPVAFGIFKLIVGVTVEDEKVSVDGLQERIEELEDQVQSVEIQSFTKI